ncbi:RnfH family protein [Legionella yabuuchiae]|uniref:RnfH family protein n=1 Tax=Legionella yabuuchiae TaxID=376727 RepID=UPI001055C4CD|nr:RnfH family protein [Legionella yabuuchiae]
MVTVEVIYAPRDKPLVHLKLTVNPGSTVADVLEQSGIKKNYPEVAQLSLGIFAKKVAPDTTVKPGDRIEIYRPLLIDPKEKRRQRAK